MLATDVDVGGVRLPYQDAIALIARGGGSGVMRWWPVQRVVDRRGALLAFGHDGAAGMGLLPEYRRLVLGIE